MAKELPLYAKRLRDARKRAGLTQTDVCERLKISLSTYRRYEQGVTEPKSTVFFQILEAINPPEYEEISGNIKQKLSKKQPLVVIPDTPDEATYTVNLLRAFNLLNTSGKKVAIERTEELTEISKYRKTDTEE